MEGKIFEGLHQFADEREGTTTRLLELPWMEGPIDGPEVDTLETLGTISSADEELGDRFIALRWIRDGISEDELTAVHGLRWLALQQVGELPDTSIRVNRENIGKALNLPWVQDDITKTESNLILELGKFSFGAYDTEYETAGAALEMPFLRSADPTDRLMVAGLRILAQRDMTSEVLNHPRFRGGITEESALEFAATAHVANKEETRRTLEPGYAKIETLSRGTKLTPNMTVSIVRVGTKSHPETIEGTWKAVEFLERTMQTPFPVGHVLVVLSKETKLGIAAGQQVGLAIYHIPYDEHADITREILISGLTHEAAHHYWGPGETAWSNEGMAETLKYIYEAETEIRDRIPSRPPTGPGNCKADDLETLEKGEHQRPIGQTDYCPYYLGASLFLELLEELGTDEFNRRIQELHRVYEAARNVGVYPTAEAYKYTDIHGLRQVFHDQLEIVERHWSGRMNAPENRP